MRTTHRYSPYTTKKPKSLELIVGSHNTRDTEDEVTSILMTNRLMGSFHGTNDMTKTLSLAMPKRMDERLRSNAQTFDKEECKDQKLHQ